MNIFDIIVQHQLNIMLSLGNVCGAVALSMLISGLNSKRRKILFFLQLSASILLISDRYLWLYDGNMSAFGWWMTRINAFLCYEMTIMVFLAINLYLKELFAASGDLNPNLNTPVVCLTADAVSGAREEFISAGFSDYLTKPIDASLLEDILIELLPAEKVTLV